MKEFESLDKLMPDSTKTLEALLVKAEADLDALSKDYQQLINNDMSKKAEYEESMLEIETHEETILDIRLAIGT